MSRIRGCFEQLQSKNRKALIPFITAGDPQPEITVPLMHALSDAGASIIELGVPFSDPMADGPVIQRANERALQHHVSLRDVLGMVKQFREKNSETPVVVMGYLNPIEIFGYQAFADAAADAGVDGVITVDIPPEEGGEYIDCLHQREIDPIFLLSPTTTEDRIRKICASASGFVYYVSIKGITGAANLDVSGVARKLEAIRKLTDLPIGVGFGIKDPETARAVSRVANAVIVGSALVNKVEALAGQPEAIAPTLGKQVAAMRTAMDQG